jgi:hypothetical protein
MRWYTLVISATWEVKIGRIMAPDQPGQKSLRDPISINKTGAVVHVCDPSYLEFIDRRILDPGSRLT